MTSHRRARALKRTFPCGVLKLIQVDLTSLGLVNLDIPFTHKTVIQWLSQYVRNRILGRIVVSKMSYTVTKCTDNGAGTQSARPASVERWKATSILVDGMIFTKNHRSKLFRSNVFACLMVCLLFGLALLGWDAPGQHHKESLRRLVVDLISFVRSLLFEFVWLFSLLPSLCL